MRALTIEGGILGFLVIINGIYVVVFPPSGDEPQGYAIFAIGIFIILVTLYLDGTAGNNDKVPPIP